MICLDIDLKYLCTYLNISISSIEKYRYKTITEILETEAQKGNTRAAEYMIKLASNPNELLKAFKLVNPKNRYLILKNMNEEDLMKVMENLETGQFLLGLSMFNPDALVKLMKFLPTESLTKVVLSAMSPDKFLKELPEEYLNEFLSSDKIDREMMMKAMEDVDEDQLQKMMENYTGQPCYDKGDNILSTLSELNDDDFMKAVFSFEPKGKQQLISGLLTEKPDLFQEFSQDALTHPFKTMQKKDILKSLSVLDPKEFLPMMEKLPQEIMALIATQIDPKVFSELLTKDFSQVIAQCGTNL